jgi:acyl-CoA reductase-like NAD-dependent aldehyde dehydrogenase
MLAAMYRALPLSTTTSAHTAVDVDVLVARAAAAQRVFENWSERRVDALLKDVAQAISDNAEELAEATVAETRLGNVADKILKNRVASEAVYRSQAGKPGTGFLRLDTERNVAEIASPVGVVFGLIPKTNPVSTFVFKVLIALKARNALILSCHRDAQEVGNQTGQLIAAVLAEHRAPAHLVQWLRGRVDRHTTRALMEHPGVALILATGSAQMVRAAYSSGTPALGVGPGNAPAWVCGDADVDTVARAVVASKSFDNGIICASEHNLVVDATIGSRLIEALERHGAAVLQGDDVAQFVDTLVDPTTNRIRGELIGQSAGVLLERAGIQRSSTVRLIVIPAGLDALSGPLGREKLLPVVSLFTVTGDEQGLAVCRQILANDGAGHTAIIHTTDPARIARFGLEMQASRILVNAPGVHGTLGIGTGLEPSMSVGCGTFGGTSTTDNITYRHLLNIKRLAYGGVAQRNEAMSAAA